MTKYSRMAAVAVALMALLVAMHGKRPYEPDPVKPPPIVAPEAEQASQAEAEMILGPAELPDRTAIRTYLMATGRDAYIDNFVEGALRAVKSPDDELRKLARAAAEQSFPVVMDALGDKLIDKIGMAKLANIVQKEKTGGMTTIHEMAELHDAASEVMAGVNFFSIFSKLPPEHPAVLAMDNFRRRVAIARL